MFHNARNKFAIQILLVFLVTTCLRAQESAQQAPRSAGTVYRVDYVFTETQDGKKLNARSYSLLIGSNERYNVQRRGSIRLGNRVPVLTGGAKEAGGSNQIQYLDIGVSIDGWIEQELDSAVALQTNVEVSSLAPEQPGENRTGDPVVRQTRFQVGAVVPLGKPTLLSSGDEVDGTRRFQVEVTATKVR